MHFIHAQFLGHALGNRALIPGEHDCTRHAQGFQLRNRFRGAFLHPVCNHDVPHIYAIQSHMDNGTLTVARPAFHMHIGHQALIPRIYRPAVHQGMDTSAGNFLHIGDTAFVQRTVPCGTKRRRDGMVGIAFCQSGQLQQLFFRNLVGMNGGYFKGTAGQRPGFVKHRNVCLGQLLQIVGTFNQHPPPGCAAHAAKESQRHGDNQRAGAGNHQERQRPLDPFRPFPHKQRWNQRQQQCGQANRRSIPTGKTGNKPFRARLAFSGILHQAQNPRHCGAFVGAGGTQAKHPRLIHATAEHGIPLGNIPGDGFSRKGGRVEG